MNDDPQFWKTVAAFTFAFFLWIVLDLKGCVPIHPDGWSGM